MIAPFETKTLGTLLLIPGATAPTEAPPGTDSAAEEPTGEESEAAADTTTSEPRSATSHVQILFSNTGFSASLVKYLFSHIKMYKSITNSNHVVRN